MNEILNDEAKAFDLRIKERMNAGHIPDLRRVKSCHYFYNNVWREPLYVSISIGTRFSFILKHINALRLQTPRVLEIGCGVGFISLELARNGCNVIGIDISEKNIEVAKKMAKENPYKKGFGSLEYHVSEIFNFLENCKNTFDAIVFYGILHHFSFFELKRLCPLMKKSTKKMA